MTLLPISKAHFDPALEAVMGTRMVRPPTAKGLTSLPTAALLDLAASLRKYSEDQPRDERGRFGEGGDTYGGTPPSAAEQAADAAHAAAYVWSGGPQTDDS